MKVKIKVSAIKAIVIERVKNLEKKLKQKPFSSLKRNLSF